MNPQIHLRNWLLACGDQFGIRQAHEDIWDDESTRPKHSYFEYKVISSEPIHVGFSDESTADSYNLSWQGVQWWNTKVEVNLYRRPDGIAELAACCIAAQYNDQIIALFDEQASFVGVESLTNETEIFDGQIDYHMKLVCTFEDQMEFELSETNGVIDTMIVTDALVIN
ncbi:MAG: hypothetical protein GY847_28870 [Proteobacteria bacterium]|nr:hypothetical protein [Pseudomonadota bacterium]